LHFREVHVDEKILTALDVARRDKCNTVREWIVRVALKRSVHWNGKISAGSLVQARIDHGRWLADCECGGAEYVDPGDPIFFCLACGNRAQAGAARLVAFPKDAAEIEAVLLARPVEATGHSAFERAMTARPLVPGLGRSWRPGESLAQLRKQNRVMGGIKNGL
jgi:hypothetical protein